MRAVAWTCDRCGTTVARPYETVITEDYGAIRSGVPPEGPLDWQTLYPDDESVVDVCPNCLTAGERADQLFREAESAVMFDREDPA